MMEYMCLTVPAKVISLEKDKATVDFVGKKQKIDIQLVKVKIGDYVIVSNGFAIKKVATKEAKEILKIINPKSFDGASKEIK
jgi:hydrogenase expression/formation protein HypC